MHFPGAEKYPQPFGTTVQGAQTPGLSTQLPRHRFFVEFQLRCFFKPSMGPGFSAENHLTGSINSELGSSHAKSKVHSSYGYF